MENNPHPARNRLLAALPPEEYQRLQPHLEFVQLSNRRTLCESGDFIQHAYFLNRGMGSLLALTQGGATVEIAMVGNEGMLGVPVILGVHKAPYQIMVQLPGEGIRIKTNVIQTEFKRGGALQDLLLNYTRVCWRGDRACAVSGRLPADDGTSPESDGWQPVT